MNDAAASRDVFDQRTDMGAIMKTASRLSFYRSPTALWIAAIAAVAMLVAMLVWLLPPGSSYAGSTPTPQWLVGL